MAGPARRARPRSSRSSPTPPVAQQSGPSTGTAGGQIRAVLSDAGAALVGACPARLAARCRSTHVASSQAAIYICRIVSVRSDDRPKRKVLEAFLQDPEQPRYGYELMKLADVASGTLYPLLANMVRKGMVTTSWETTVDGRPPRKLYRLTGDGVAVARLELAAMTDTRPTRLGVRPATSGGAA